MEPQAACYIQHHWVDHDHGLGGTHPANGDFALGDVHEIGGRLAHCGLERVFHNVGAGAAAVLLAEMFAIVHQNRTHASGVLFALLVA